MIVLDDTEACLVLEALRCHAEEGFHFHGHYSGRVPTAAKVGPSAALDLARRLCDALLIPIADRDWLKE